MKSLLNPKVFLIFLGVVLQSFCTNKLIWHKSVLGNSTGELFSLNQFTTFLFAWMVLTFFSKTLGAYCIGKVADAKGFIKTKKILALGYVITTCSFFVFSIEGSHIHEIRQIMLLITCVNVFLYPPALLLPAIYLMKNYDRSCYVKIGTLLLFGSELGYTLSYLVIECDKYLMAGIICAASCLYGLLYYLGENILGHFEFFEMKKIHKNPKVPMYKAKLLAVTLGGVSCAGLTYNYFFIGPYVLNILIMDEYKFKFSYLFFYGAIGLFLPVASKIADYVDWAEMMFKSLIGLLLIALSFRLFAISEAFVVYQLLFAFFLAGFLAPCLALLFSLFQAERPYYNCIVWYSLGLSSSYFLCYFLSEEFGFFKKYFLVFSPLFLSGNPSSGLDLEV